jgi:Spy/CpxP family protein refolding chaperone
MKNAFLLILLLLISLLTFSGAASAQDNPPPPPEGERMPPPGANGPPRPEDERGEILRQLNLSQDQFKSIRKLLGENQPKVRDAQREFRDAQEALDDAIYADTVDEATVQGLVKRVGEAQATLIRLRTANEFAIRRVLTPEQVTKFRDLRKEQLLRKMMQERIRMQRQNGPNGPPNGRPGMQRPGDQPPMQQPGNNATPRPQGRKPVF